eukprot:scaffold142958_cov20-Tisochrysis_lutea.AAC.1
MPLHILNKKSTQAERSPSRAPQESSARTCCARTWAYSSCWLGDNQSRWSMRMTCVCVCARVCVCVRARARAHAHIHNRTTWVFLSTHIKAYPAENACLRKRAYG